jgi:hypothetical protein
MKTTDCFTKTEDYFAKSEAFRHRSAIRWD